MYTYDIRVGFSQSDTKHNMTIPAIIDTYQDCSCFHSEDLGVGIYKLEPQKLVWVINYWEVEFLRAPKYPEKLTVGTFPYEFKGFLGMRNFFLKDEQGEYISKANSLWCLMDWENMRPAKVPAEIKDAYISEDKLDMTYSPRKISIPDEEDERVKRDDEPVIFIEEHHLDSNGHVNNGQYIKIAFAYVPKDIEYKRLRVEYKTQAHLGDEIHPVLYTGKDFYTVVLSNNEGAPYAVIELKY